MNQSKTKEKSNNQHISSMGGLSQIKMFSNINKPKIRTKDYSGMGGLSKIQPFTNSSFNKKPQHQSIGMGGMSRINLNSEFKANNKINSKQKVEKEMMNRKLNGYSGMGGLSKINLESIIRTTPNRDIHIKNNLNESKGTNKTEDSDYLKTTSKDSFKKGEINFSKKEKFQSDIRISSK